MLQSRGASPAADLPAVAASALQRAAERCGLDPSGARLIRLFATAVFHLPAADAVARIALVTSTDTVTRLATSVRATRWLVEIGFPTVEPLPVDQPLTSHGCAVTFWRYLLQSGSEPGPADLARLLRRLHQLDPPPVPLPTAHWSPSAGRSRPAAPSMSTSAPGSGAAASNSWTPTANSTSRSRPE
jgi:hypothetical protein